jgi:hypothetical protein
MNETGVMLVFRKDEKVMMDYLNSLYKESAEGEPSEPIVRAIQTVTGSGKKAGLVKMGGSFRKDSKVVQLIIDALIKLNMPVKIESGNREVESSDFERYLDMNDKVIIIETRARDNNSLIIKYGGREYKKKASQDSGGQVPELVRWLETKAICPEIIVFEVHSPPWKANEAEDIAYTILREMVE